MRLTYRTRTSAGLALAFAIGACDDPGAGTANASDTEATEVAPDTADALADSATAPDTDEPDSAAPTDASEDATPDDAAVEEDTGEVPVFSFFVTSLRAMQELSGSADGFGGDLRYGEEGPGAGLRGADLICATIAEESLPGAGKKQWRAFLSAAEGEDGQAVHAIDRIGEGPWYDRLGRLFANGKSELLADRPTNADAAIKNDFPNEDGVGNHRPDPNQGQVDNHDFLTGSNDEGRLYSATATCLSWTGGTGNKTLEGKPRVGHSWPRSGGPGGGGGGGGPGGDTNMANWMSALTESGCAPGVNLIETGGPSASSNTVGSGGGYGGIYCFALTP